MLIFFPFESPSESERANCTPTVPSILCPCRQLSTSTHSFTVQLKKCVSQLPFPEKQLTDFTKCFADVLAIKGGCCKTTSSVECPLLRQESINSKTSANGVRHSFKRSWEADNLYNFREVYFLFCRKRERDKL